MWVDNDDARKLAAKKTREHFNNNPQALVDMSNKHKKLHEENPNLAIEHSIKMQEYFNDKK